MNNKMQEYLQKIKVFFRIAPHLKDKPFYAKAFWYYLVLLAKLSANEEKLVRVIPVLVFCSYSAYRIYGILLFFKVLIVSVLIVELSCRFLKGNQYIFDKLSLVYGPELKTKFGNPFDHHTLTAIIKYTAWSISPIIAIDHGVSMAERIADSGVEPRKSLLEKLVDSWANHVNQNSTIVDQNNTISEITKLNGEQATKILVQEAVIASQAETIQSSLNAMAEAAANNSSNDSFIEEPTIKLLPRSEGAPLDPKLLDPFRKYEP